jgi:hypothetical protein
MTSLQKQVSSVLLENQVTRNALRARMRANNLTMSTVKLANGYTENVASQQT